MVVCYLGIVGSVDDSGIGYYMWTHKKLDIGYNGNQVSIPFYCKFMIHHISPI